MNWIALTETLTLLEANSPGVLLGEDVRKAGLNPEVFLAVLPGECGRAGRLNLNERIYAVDKAVAAHEQLCREAAVNKNFGERNHPEAGPTWDVISRFLGGSTKIEEDGSALFEGRFGILNTSLGRDLMVLWKAGVPIGMSLRAEGVVEDHVLDEKSQYLKMNKDKAGKKARLVTEVRFHGYDHVRTPSAETYLPAPVQEAARRLREAQEKENSPMVFKTFAALMLLNAEDAKLIEAELKAKFQGELKESHDTELTTLKTRAAQAERELTEAKAKLEGKDDAVKELTSLLKEEKAERLRAEGKGKIVEALDGWMVGRHNGMRIKNFVLAENLDTPERALARASALSDLMKEAATVPGDPAKVTEGKDSGGVGIAVPGAKKTLEEEVASL